MATDVPRRRRGNNSTPERPAVEESLRELRLLHEAAHQLSSTLDPHAVLQEASNITAQLLWPPGSAQRRAQINVLDDGRMIVTAETDDLAIELKGCSFPLSAHPVLRAWSRGKRWFGMRSPRSLGPTSYGP